MDQLNIVRGDLSNKPESSKQLASYFEARKKEFEGTLYVGYPIIGTPDGGFQIDALLITRSKGLIVFTIEEGADVRADFANDQDENFTKLTSKLLQYSDLRDRRKLAFPIRTATYAPAWNGVDSSADYPCLTDDEMLTQYLDSIVQDPLPKFEEVLSAIQSVTTIRKVKPRSYVSQENSRGAKLKRLEASIANLDRQQSAAVIETVEGVQRIRGLAGSGKTIVLALKVAYLHAKNPDWRIAVTFNTRSLKEQFKKYINTFTIEHINEEPNWEKIDIYHAWGTTSSSPGIYSNICQDHGIEFHDLNSAKKLAPTYGEQFDKVCEVALGQIKNFQQKYDLIVVDEAQDFSKEFLRMCFYILKEPKRLVYAYDELQSLSSKTMYSPEELFGSDENGNPLVRLENEPNQPLQDIILYKCYRNPLEILTAAHALGFGIYRGELVQMFENAGLWRDIGYEVESGELADGQEVELKRTRRTSPEFLSDHSPVEDLISFKVFDNNQDQIEYIVSDIVQNLANEELRPDDIIVINPNPLTTQKVVGEFRSRLFEKNINTSLAGVSSSPDVFFEPDVVTFTGIYRAKGNEAAMVYVINAQYCFQGIELARKRNILFTAMTRSKAWLRVCGYGESMKGLEAEYRKVVENDFRLKFRYPTLEERQHINLVNRDMSQQERNQIKLAERSLTTLLDDLREGRVRREDLPKETVEQLKLLLS